MTDVATHPEIPTEVPCPRCNNANREARRLCTICGHKGVVVEWMKVERVDE